MRAGLQCPWPSAPQRAPVRRRAVCAGRAEEWAGGVQRRRDGWWLARQECGLRLARRLYRCALPPPPRATPDTAQAAPHRTRAAASRKSAAGAQGKRALAAGTRHGRALRAEFETSGFSASLLLPPWPSPSNSSRLHCAAAPPPPPLRPGVAAAAGRAGPRWAPRAGPRRADHSQPGGLGLEFFGLACSTPLSDMPARTPAGLSLWRPGFAAPVGTWSGTGWGRGRVRESRRAGTGCAVSEAAVPWKGAVR